MRYVLAMALLLAGCAAQEGRAPYMGPPLVFDPYIPPPAPVYRQGITCQTIGTMTFCN